MMRNRRASNCLAVLLLVTLTQTLFAQSQTLNETDDLLRSAITSYQQNDFTKAVEAQTRAIELLDVNNMSNTAKYAEALKNLALYYSALGQNDRSLSYVTRSIEITDSLYTSKNMASAFARLDLASYYSDCSQYGRALDLGKEAVQTLEVLDNVPRVNYAVAMAKLSMFYENASDHEHSLSTGLKALILIEETFGVKSDRYAQMLDLLSYIYYERGDIEQALSFCRRSCDIFEQFPESPYYINALNDLAAYYCDSGEPQQAIELGIKARERAGLVYGTGNFFYINTVNNLARYYSAIEDFDNALKYSSEALDICDKMGYNNNLSYARSLGHLANFYYQKGDYNSAIVYAEKSRPLFESIFGTNTAGYVNCLRDLTRYYFRAKEIKEVESYASETEEMIEEIVLRAFAYMPSHDRSLYWNWYKDWFYIEMPSLCFSIQTPPVLCETYNALLFSKGILLNTDVEERRLMAEKNGDSSVELYHHLQALRSELDMKSGQGDLSQHERDSLSREIERYVEDLSNASELFGSYIRKQHTSWQDVRVALKDGEIAIEFMKVNSEQAYSYVALTLKRDYEYPHIVELFDDDDFESVPVSSYYREAKLSKLIWGKLSAELENVKKVYFSPDGCLQIIGIEYMPLTDQLNVADVYNLCRLTSTRELCAKKQAQSKDYAVLYGGLNYDKGIRTNRTSLTESEDEQIKKSLYRGVSERGAYGPTPQTEYEVASIQKLLKKSSYVCQTFSGEDGNEESFKGLSGSSLNIIHLATHGDYIPPSNSYESKFAYNLAYQEAMKRNYSDEDLVMTRSFIVLSGGNQILQPDFAIEDYAEDGLLTSLEISKLTFPKLNLVVLSACKTALGDVSEDGVVGLQRGFKKAGADAIIMSLWSVEDEPTQYLMTRFYKYYIRKHPVSVSFKKAQNDLKKKYGTGGNKPYWASFILLDALN